MPLSTGDRLGPYEIVAAIGAGGMGEVFKARDTRLGRTVAIKISKTEFTERFEREAHAVAALNHPHICQLYDVGPNYLVFEYVEGEPLKGPLPLKKALDYAAQICEALEAAHGKQITHRDLKPANILVTKQGIKLLDFGLAKIDRPAAVSEETVTMALTSQGQILGTLQYMAPEQLQGKEADARSDIFSLGCVLYEMLTGKRAFDGASGASVIAAILERPTPSVADVAPKALDRVLKRCLEKDPEQRWQSALDLRAALEMVETADSATEAPSREKPMRTKLPWAISGLLTVALGALGWAYLHQQPPAAPALVFRILLPDKATLSETPVVSPDGRKVAFIIGDVNNRRAIYVRPLDTLNAEQVTSYDEDPPAHPFWSPDSRFIGYSSGMKLKKVAADGGPSQIVCDLGGVFLGGTWNRAGLIVYALASSQSTRSGIWKISDAGGAPSQIASAFDPGLIFSPAFLPDGTHFLYARFSSPGSIGAYAGSITDKLGQTTPQPLLSMNSQPVFAPSRSGADQGYILFLRDNALYAQPLNTSNLTLVGDAQPVTSPVGASVSGRIEPGVFTGGFFSASENGVLVFRPGSNIQEQLTWLDRQGKPLGTVGDPGLYSEIDLSPDGKRLAAVRNGDIWIVDLDRNVTTRFTLDGANNHSPVWSRDGTRIAFESDRDGVGTIFVKQADGVSQEMLYQGDQGASPTDWAPDGRALVFTSTGKSGTDVMLLPLAPGFKPDPPARPIAQTQFNEGQGKISPDGRWIVHASSETGGNQAYVRPFPSGDAKWLISKNVGIEYRWRRDGRELYFRSGNSIMAVEIKPGPTFQPGEPKELFQAPVVGAGAFNRNPSYIVTADGQKFLAVLSRSDTLSSAMTVMTDWQAELKK